MRHAAGDRSLTLRSRLGAAVVDDWFSDFVWWGLALGAWGCSDCFADFQNGLGFAGAPSASGGMHFGSFGGWRRWLRLAVLLYTAVLQALEGFQGAEPGSLQAGDVISNLVQLITDLLFVLVHDIGHVDGALFGDELVEVAE